jgi:hypothetical protein
MSESVARHEVVIDGRAEDPESPPMYFKTMDKEPKAYAPSSRTTPVYGGRLRL